ncbi:hypothetical protein NDU88_006002 [Pleurodeles waltl]|uniref:Uncharacterized protein n=2 Tax=Pleurodeles waltl TaxID=8319 RepID=A0AAV7PHD2_PLEWA|nr:hypothetical protein NDU88_006002 [Pleurodeles waltl]
MVPHAVDILLNKTQTQHLTSARLTGYELTLFSPNITLKRCNVLNPATLLPLPQDNVEFDHNCIFATEEETKGRVDLTDTPLSDPQGELFVDGSCFKLPDGTTTAAYAVTTVKTVVESHRIPQNSAQAAELIALTRACEISEHLSVNIYTDSQYAFGVAHNFGRLWANRGFITSHGTTIQHGNLIVTLLTALSLPRQVAIIKCSAHKKITDDIGRGNAFADATAKATARAPFDNAYVESSIKGEPQYEVLENTMQCVRDIQAEATAEEREQWEKNGRLDSEGCYTDDTDRRRWMLPNCYVHAMVTMAHSPAHISAQGIKTTLDHVWSNPLISKAANNLDKSCMVCAVHNAGKGTPTPPGHFAPPDLPFEAIQMDFIHIEPCNKLKYVLVVVCMFSKWIEAYPLKDNGALSTAKILLKEYFPRYALPRLVWSDNGSHFSNEVMEKVCTALNIKHRFHAANHPQSAGLVERYNYTLKSKIAKICAETNLKWPDALPLALMSIRMTASSKSRLSPYEVVMGRPANIWGVPRPKKLSEVQYPLFVDYCKQLTKDLRLIHQQVKASLPTPLEGPGHPFKPGDWLMTKNFQRTNSLQPRWRGPAQVLLATQTAVKVEGRKNWIHASHCKRAPIPLQSTLTAELPLSPDYSEVGRQETPPQVSSATSAPEVTQQPSDEELLFEDQQTHRCNLRPRPSK